MSEPEIKNLEVYTTEAAKIIKEMLETNCSDADIAEAVSRLTNLLIDALDAGREDRSMV